MVLVMDFGFGRSEEKKEVLSQFFVQLHTNYLFDDSQGQIQHIIT